MKSWGETGDIIPPTARWGRASLRSTRQHTGEARGHRDAGGDRSAVTAARASFRWIKVRGPQEPVRLPRPYDLSGEGAERQKTPNEIARLSRSSPDDHSSRRLDRPARRLLGGSLGVRCRGPAHTSSRASALLSAMACGMYRWCAPLLAQSGVRSRRRETGVLLLAKPGTITIARHATEFRPLPGVREIELPSRLVAGPRTPGGRSVVAWRGKNMGSLTALPVGAEIPFTAHTRLSALSR